MKRKVLVFGLVLLIAAFAIAFASCGADEITVENCSTVGHSWRDATCTTAKTCARCGITEGFKLGHDYTEKIEDEAHLKSAGANCAAFNEYWYDCSRCDANAGFYVGAYDKYYVSTVAGDHSVALDYTSENGQHFHKCTVSGCNYVTEKVNCAGGSATCQQKAVCSVCFEEYGSTVQHSYDLTAWGYKGADGHAHKCIWCNAHDTVQAHTPNIPAATETEAKVCTESGCGYVIEPMNDHQHMEGLEWKYNATHHWHDCIENDGQEYNKAAHVFDSDCDTDCVCGYVRTVTHNYNVPKYDATHHWNECACGEADTKAPHVFEGDCDTDCACGYVRSITHNFSIPNKDGSFHWNECACGTADTKVAHSYIVPANDESHHWSVCSCGAEGTKVAHSYVIPENDDTYHWNKCECGATDTKAPHSFDDASDTNCDCGYDRGHQHVYSVRDYDTVNHWFKCECGTIDTATVSAHEFDGACDTDCACGYVRTITHNFNVPKYDDTRHWNECACGTADTKVPHVFDGDCDTDCACGYVRSITHNYNVPKYDTTQHWNECACGAADTKVAHVFDNACDTDCACGYVRAITHAYTLYDHDADKHWKKCSVCGDPEANKVDHVYDNDCDTTCGCGYVRTITHNYNIPEYDDAQHWNKCQCGDIDTKIDHVFDNACDTDCACGYVRTITHSYTDLKHTATEHWYECSVCHVEKQGSRVGHSGGAADCKNLAKCYLCDQAYGSLGACDYEESVVKKATTFEGGTLKYTCSVCGDSYTVNLPATKSLKLLAIGNSFSEDAFMHLYIVCKDAGIEELVLGNLYIGGCSLEKHYTQMSTDTAAYILWLSDPSSGGMVKYANGDKQTAKFGIEYAAWDYITLQQNSANSGLPDTYEWLDDIIAYVNLYKTNANAEFFWHMTWAYQGDSTHSSFPNYDNDQLKMYNAILNCVNNVVLANPDIKGVIPSGTAVQNLRNSHLGDTLTRDGHHLSYGIGRYTAAMTYLAAITGYDINNITATPSAYTEVADHLSCIKEAVTNAIAKPYEITPSTDYPYVAPPAKPTEIVNTTLSPLTSEDREYLTSNGYDPDKYMLLDLEITENAYYDSSKAAGKNGDLQIPGSGGNTYNKFLGTQLFSRNELVNGTLIRVDNGYRYRPDAWITLGEINASRPNNVSTALTEVTNEWWGDFTYRGFNISKSSGTIVAEEGSNFKIYIPVASKSELNAADREYLYGIGLNPNDYMVLDYTYTFNGYYNASNNNPFNISTGTSDLHKEFICTNEKFTRYDIPVGSVIHIADTNYRYRAEGWIIPTQKVTSDDRPARITTETVIVDVDWWGDWGYRAFNIQTKNNAVMEDPGDKMLVRIYVPVEREYIELNDDDKAYLEGLGLNASEYKVLNINYTVGGFYDASSNGASINTSNSSLSKKFIGSEIYTKDQLTNGSVIRIAEGYQYRPEGWIALNQKVEKGDRPGNVTTETVIIDDAWWGDWNYRGFNLSATDSHAITAPESDALRIYVKIA